MKTLEAVEIRFQRFCLVYFRTEELAGRISPITECILKIRKDSLFVYSIANTDQEKKQIR